MVENMIIQANQVDFHILKSHPFEEDQNNQPVDQAVRIEVAQVDLDCQHKSELFLVWWTHETSRHDS